MLRLMQTSGAGVACRSRSATCPFVPKKKRRMGAAHSADDAVAVAQITHAADVQATVGDAEAAVERVHERPILHNPGEDAWEVQEDIMLVPSLWPDVVQTLGDVKEMAGADVQTTEGSLDITSVMRFELCADGERFDFDNIPEKQHRTDVHSPATRRVSRRPCALPVASPASYALYMFYVCMHARMHACILCILCMCVCMHACTCSPGELDGRGRCREKGCKGKHRVHRQAAAQFQWQQGPSPHPAA